MERMSAQLAERYKLAVLGQLPNQPLSPAESNLEGPFCPVCSTLPFEDLPSDDPPVLEYEISSLEPLPCPDLEGRVNKCSLWNLIRHLGKNNIPLPEDCRGCSVRMHEVTCRLGLNVTIPEGG